MLIFTISKSLFIKLRTFHLEKKLRKKFVQLTKHILHCLQISLIQQILLNKIC